MRELCNNTFNQIHYHISPPIRFGEKYEEELRTSERIDVFLNSNLVNIHLDEGTGGVSSFECVNYVDPTNRQRLIGKAFVLALGGIENPRLLLNCRDQLPQGIGNNRDLVGRFFMEHLPLHCGFYVANMKVWPFGDEVFSSSTTNASDERLFLSATKAFRDSQHIGNVVLRLGSIDEGDSRSLVQKFKSQTKSMLCANDIIRDFMQSIRSFRCPVDRPSVEPLPVDSAGYLRVSCEQVPNRNSRVLLAEEKDRFGMRRAALDWRTTDVERRTIKLMVTAFGHYLASRGYGNVKLADWLLIDDSPIPGVAEDPYLGAAWHHMGTTRMATVPEEGVVDPNCRVFGVGNLYIVGSSVFPTGGEANPTLTIVQLTLRLCDHLDRMLAA